jgi:hypothetical protein
MALGPVDVLPPLPPPAGPAWAPWLALILVLAPLAWLLWRRRDRGRRLPLRLARALGRSRIRPRQAAHRLAGHLRAYHRHSAGAQDLLASLDALRFRREGPSAEELLPLLRAAQRLPRGGGRHG